MFAGYKRRLFPRLLLHLIFWLLISRIAADTLPVRSFLLLFGSSLLLALLVEEMDFRSLSALMILAFLPWLLRLFVPGLNRVAFDNTWLLLWPVWYTSTFLFFLGIRYSAAARIEVLILVLGASAALRFSGDWNLDLAAPMLATAKMGAAAIVSCLSLFGFWRETPTSLARPVYQASDRNDTDGADRLRNGFFC